MKPLENENRELRKQEVPEWLKVIQINSWEAELLISALLLYMLFQVPEIIEQYSHQHYPEGLMKLVIRVFIQALRVLRIGYSIHIIARGIWVASVGLSHIYPRSLNLEKLKFKNRFKKELEGDLNLEKTIKRLEKVASLSYAISFMLSGMVISVGLLFFYLMVWQELVMTPSLESGNYIGLTIGTLVIFLYLGLLLIVFIDFLTNGLFRREAWTSKPYYYISSVFRVITLSFIYSKISLTLISNLSKWQAYLVPISAIVLIVGFRVLESKMEDWDEERYLETAFDTISRMNYETLRVEGDPVFATIQNDVVEGGVIRLFLNTHGQMSRLYTKEDDYSRQWKELSNPEQSEYAKKYVKVQIDGKPYDSLNWSDYVHPQSYDIGFLNYIDIEDLSKGIHTLTVELDTANFNELQKKVILDQDPVKVKYAKISFYKAN